MVKKILLLNPPRVRGLRFTREGRCQESEGILGTVKPPLSLAIIASMFREAGLEFLLIDADALGMNPTNIVSILHKKQFCPDIILFATGTGSIGSDIQSVSLIKRWSSAKLISIGGPGSIIPLETLRRYSELDAALVGEPEPSIIKLIKSNFNFRSIDSGLVFRDVEGLLGSDKPVHQANLNDLPIPAWDLIPLDKYRVPLLGTKYALLEINRGCPYTCGFCTVPILHGNNFRQRNLDLVLIEIKNLQAQGVTTFHLWGDSTTINKAYMREFSERLINEHLNVLWFSNTRAETLADEELVHLMKKSGCWMLGFGAESGSADTLMDMKKGLKLDASKRAVTILRKFNIISIAYFIFGYIGESNKQLESTSQFAMDLDPDFAYFNLAVPYPGTPLYANAIQTGLISDNLDWSILTMENYVLGTKEQRKIVTEVQKKTTRRFYLRLSKLFHLWKLFRHPISFSKALLKGRLFLQ